MIGNARIWWWLRGRYSRKISRSMSNPDCRFWMKNSSINEEQFHQKKFSTLGGRDIERRSFWSESSRLSWTQYIPSNDLKRYLPTNIWDQVTQRLVKYIIKVPFFWWGGIDNGFGRELKIQAFYKFPNKRKVRLEGKLINTQFETKGE